MRIFCVRSYHVAIAGIVADSGEKWIDNLLSHHQLVGVDKLQRGVSRRISIAGIRQIALVRRLVQQLGVPTAVAVSLAARIWEGETGILPLGDGLELRVDLPSLRHDIDVRVARAVESVALARRGRPPKRIHAT
jgi:hypothetical protein